MNNPYDSSRRRFLAQAGAVLLARRFGRQALADEAPVPNIVERLRQEIGDAPLSMQFAGGTAEVCRQWQAEFGRQLRTLLGPHAPPKQWKTVVRANDELPDHRRLDLVLSAEGCPPLPVYLLLPTGHTGRRPGIVALHGHGAHGHHPIAGRDDLPGVAQAIENNRYDYGRQLVRRGYVVAAPCLTPFGERLGKPEAFGKQDPCGDTFIRMQALGRVLMAENLRDALWCVELLAQHEQVDAGRLGCVGLSYGGRMTMLTAAIEPRIKAAVVSGALNVMQERMSRPYSCGAQIIPGLLRYGDVPEIASLIAPRPCLWQVGDRDGLIDANWAEQALTRMRRAYDALSASDRLTIDRFDGGHIWHGDAAYPMLERALN